MSKEASMDALSGKHALVTGAGSGIGFACARALLDAGAGHPGRDPPDCP